MAARVQSEAVDAQQVSAAETAGEAEATTVTGTVARGRTLRVGGVDLDENRNVKRVWHKDFGPGDEVEVSPEEHAALVASGVFVDPTGKAVKVQTGANVGVFAGG